MNRSWRRGFCLPVTWADVFAVGMCSSVLALDEFPWPFCIKIGDVDRYAGDYDAGRAVWTIMISWYTTGVPPSNA